MKKYFILSVLVIALSSCKTTIKERWDYFPNEINLSDYNHLDFVKVKKGKTVTVHIEENASTGYAWVTNSMDDCTVNINEGTYVQGESEEGMVGVPGMKTFEVNGQKNGVCLVEFWHKRSNEEPQEKKAIYFIVE